MSKFKRFRQAGTWSVLVAAATLLHAQESRPYIGRYDRPFPGPQAYVPAGGSTLLYVETDGKHLSAIALTGEILWTKVPHEETGLEAYRTDNPRIVYIGPADESALRGRSASDYVSISFNNSQALLVNMETGAFELLGQD